MIADRRRQLEAARACSSGSLPRLNVEGSVDHDAAPPATAPGPGTLTPDPSAA